MNKNQSAYIVVGKVAGVHGQQGAIRAEILTEFPERFRRGGRLYIEGQPYTVTASAMSKRTVILKFAGIDTHDAAGLLRGLYLEIPAGERMVLPAGRYYHDDIIGLDVFTSAGTPLGRVSGILSTGSNDVYIVDNGGRETLIPAIRDVVKEIDTVRGCITIELIDGLLD